LVGHRVGPEQRSANRHGSGKIWQWRAMQMLIQCLAHLLPAGAYKWFTMAHLLAPRIASEQGDTQVGLAEADNGCQRVLVVLPVHLDINAVDGAGLASELAIELRVYQYLAHGTGSNVRVS